MSRNEEKVVPCVFSVFQLRACLGMQLMACAASVVNMICSLVNMNKSPYVCWSYNRHIDNQELCPMIDVRFNCGLKTIFSYYNNYVYKIHFEILVSDMM